ncbi:bifunctional FO biosynthesis protein CofGH [Rhodococcus sp. BP-349]|uniref:bifunctional FO biosynthesis protein CofGH n=1 Tax=unclassified Rhodococcus (in: high G+C Gram-positive bacteria) TaxID=192944 RepID=UPI001C9AF1F5|nr:MULTISPECIES: bifunctional FO biosynthesis protein CofGH [unclassified Rhodococcus (in: high G+C Gram-positive bacteria)]MBY6538638.1 bifunctional FO biosynthesis protein CofGH [Rhodococcus sp. BP-363]MBY6542975.1 bifunctional FO biosynthesis protein CofGH [Rhodococcus sp. BP-369]MBY6562205.1 bifunctional FO biosynthesis protein CofGH [Rhodococcus sp. BP-370]MBY6576497.1 bifunctional FO biosynthesis protein CofGH [Rhodococcus sp. BP-364]MBY6585798.1 bifunctional FO biosynthesis protein CofG
MLPDPSTPARADTRVTPPDSPAPTASALRRALRRARDGVVISVDEATTLLHARGDDLTDLCASAARVRDAGLLAENRPGTVTYSRKVFIPLTRLCRDTCHYCTFVTVPGKLRAEGHGMFLEADEVLDIARRGAELGCKEALFTLGDRPEARWPEAQEWLDARGYDSTLDYLRAMSIRVLEETGLLPHLNPGVMSWEEMSRLKPVAPSMGMMLETTSRRLFEEKGQAHYGSPDKDPEVRLRVLTDAGRLTVPFTTGILVGIGETIRDRAESIMAIRKSHKAFGHVQEVIVQNFLAKDDTAMRSAPDAGLEEFLATIAVSRILLGPAMRIQAPPNLVSAQECAALLAAGVDDWGGVSPLTPDHVNPERPWPNLDTLAQLSADAGFTLTERTAVQPRYVLAGSPWIDPRISAHVHALADGATGLAVPETIPSGLPWQEPDEVWESTGRVDLNTGIDTEGRNTETRSDMGSAFGDWESIREQVAHLATLDSVDRDVVAALRAAEKDPGNCTDEEYLALATAEGAALDAVTAFADQLRRDVVGDDVTYVVNRNINFTNICYTGCRFCAFAQRKGDADAFSLSTSEVADRAWEAHVLGATEVCMQGGIDPELPVTGYADLVRAVKARVPSMHVHAFSPMEIVNGASRGGQSVRDWLTELREAGLDTIPGTAAEILDDEVRWVLTKGKLPAQTWIDVVTTAHEVGLRSSSTMMYGHVDNPSHWVGHLNVLKRIQDRTGGFTEFVPLPFVHQSSPLYLAGASRPGPTQRDNRAVHALARIMLHGRIDNIQTSWVKLGVTGTRVMLNGGANDLGGTLMEETISRMAGSQHGSEKTVEELHAIAEGIGRRAVERTTAYADRTEAA